MRGAGIHGHGSRLGALFVALLLSGVLPQVGAVAEEREHRCTCHHPPGEVCSCPGCRRVAANARRAELAAMAPCHREAALAALASEDREPPAGADAVEGCCDAPERQWMALQDSNPYLQPGVVALGPATAAGHPQRAQLPEPGEIPREIPTPPPRVA